MEKTEVAVQSSEDNTLGDVVGPATSTSLDTLQFKHDFFEVLEELQLRRKEDETHKKKLQEILKEKYELEKKLEDCCMINSQLVEKHKTEQEEIRHSYEEKIRTLQEDKAKANINNLCEDGQVSRLKDEIRVLHLHKYNLEKTVSEQEHKLHMQTSSHEQFLSLVRQLEEKCTSLSQQVTEVNEHLDLLSNNVNEAIVVNVKLERQQKHHGCVVFDYQDELITTKKELLKLTTKLSLDQQADRIVTGDNPSIRDLEHQLKMQHDLTALLEKQIEELQKENASTAGALKESSSLLERQVDSFEQTKSNNVSLHEQLLAAKNHSEAMSTELVEKSNELTQLEQKCQQEEETHSKKFADMEQRLRALQSDFMALQQSSELLQCEKQQWLKEKAEHTTAMADRTTKIALLEEKLNRQLIDVNPNPVISTNKSPDLIKKVASAEVVEDNKRKCTENDLPNNKKMCLSPSVTQDDNLTALLPSMVQDSPAMPVPSSSCDPSVMPPQSISCDAPVKVHRPSPHERQTTPPLLKDFPSSHDLPIIPPGSHDVSTKPLQPSVLKPIAHPILHDSSSPSSHDLPTTPPGSQDISNMPNPVNPTAHDSAATPPNLHDASVKSHSSSRDVDEHNTSLPNDCDTSLLSTSPPLLSTKEQLEFSDPAVDIINTQLNQQITEVQHFLKTDRLKRTKLPDTNNVQ